MAERACHVFGSTTQVGLTQALEGMDTARETDRKIHFTVRLTCVLGAVLCVYLAVSVNLRHPVQVTMDVLTPLSLLLLASARSYNSASAKLALATSLYLWAVMIAAPHLFPSPLSW